MRLLRLALGVALHLLCFSSVPSDANKDIEQKIRLRFYSENKRYDNKNYLERPLDLASQLFSESKGYNSSLSLVLLVHGMAMGADSHFVNGIVHALMKKRVHKTHNIFAVDMPEVMENDLNSKLYFGVLSNVKPAGKALGGFLNFLISLKKVTPGKINIIGYSMGTQIAGYIGREVKATFGKIHYIAGMEPVGPGFHSRLGGTLPSLTHVSAGDAKITHFFHTNSHEFGSHSRVGTADFVFNNGNMQPGCGHEAPMNCSHARAPYLYEEALLAPKQFVARSCETWHRFSNCQCESRKSVVIDFPPDPRARGIYYLRTNATSPYGLGEKGSQCGPRDKGRKTNKIEPSLGEEGGLTDYQNKFIKELDVYGKKAVHSVDYFYKVLKGKEKNIDADYEEEAESENIDTGNAGTTPGESTKHPKHKSVKYEIEFKPHKNSSKGKQQIYVFLPEESKHTSKKVKKIKVSPRIKHDKIAHNRKGDSSTEVTTDEPSKKSALGKKTRGNTSKSTEQVDFEYTLQRDESKNYGGDDVIVFEDSQNSEGEDGELKENRKSAGKKMGPTRNGEDKAIVKTGEKLGLMQTRNGEHNATVKEIEKLGSVPTGNEGDKATIETDKEPTANA